MTGYRESVRADKASRVRTGFYIHLAAYVLVNALLVGINLVTTPDKIWFPWPLFGWGLGIAAHGIATFALSCRQARP